MTTPQNPFAQPDKGDKFTPRDHPEWLGKLFLIYPDSVAQRMGTDNNGQPAPYEVVEGDVAIIDLPDPQTGQPSTLKNAGIGGKALVPQIKKQVGGMVLGRLAQTAAQGQKSGAFYLADYSDADQAAAMGYIQSHPRQQFAQPAAQAVPVAAPVAQYAPAPVAPQPVAQQFPVPAPVAPAAPAIDPQLVAFLASKGVDASAMSPEQAQLIAATFGS